MDRIGYLIIRDIDDFVEECSTLIRKKVDDEPPQKVGYHTLMINKFTIGEASVLEKDAPRMVGGNLVTANNEIEGDMIFTPKPKSIHKRRRESLKLARADMEGDDTQGINANALLPAAERVKWKTCVYMKAIDQMYKDQECGVHLMTAYPSSEI
jgi:hypothetical protein